MLTPIHTPKTKVEKTVTDSKQHSQSFSWAHVVHRQRYQASKDVNPLVVQTKDKTHQPPVPTASLLSEQTAVQQDESRQVVHSLAKLQDCKNVALDYTLEHRALDAIARQLYRRLCFITKARPGALAIALDLSGKQPKLILDTQNPVPIADINAAMYELESLRLRQAAPYTDAEIEEYIVNEHGKYQQRLSQYHPKHFERGYRVNQRGKNTFYDNHEKLIKNILGDIDLQYIELYFRQHPEMESLLKACPIFVRDAIELSNIDAGKNRRSERTYPHPELTLAQYIHERMDPRYMRSIANKTEKLRPYIYVAVNVISCKKCSLLIQGEPFPAIASKPKYETFKAQGKTWLKQMNYITGLNESSFGQSCLIFLNGHYEAGYPNSYYPPIFMDIYTKDFKTITPQKILAGRLNVACPIPAKCAKEEDRFAFFLSQLPNHVFLDQARPKPSLKRRQ